jgi:hypothetical protein
VSTGSVGVIATTMNNSFAVGNAIVTDLKEKEPNPSKTGQSKIRQLLENKGSFNLFQFAFNYFSLSCL